MRRSMLPQLECRGKRCSRRDWAALRSIAACERTAACLVQWAPQGRQRGEGSSSSPHPRRPRQSTWKPALHTLVPQSSHTSPPIACMRPPRALSKAARQAATPPCTCSSLETPREAGQRRQWRSAHAQDVDEGSARFVPANIRGSSVLRLAQRGRARDDCVPLALPVHPERSRDVALVLICVVILRLFRGTDLALSELLAAVATPACGPILPRVGPVVLLFVPLLLEVLLQFIRA